MRIHSAWDDVYARAFIVEADDLSVPPETQPKLPTEPKHDPATCKHCQNNMSPATAEQRKQHNVPPGLTNVHVSNDPESHMVARGTDAKGRVKSFYSSDFEKGQAEKKFNRVKALHEKIPQLDESLSKDAPDNDDAAALLLSRHMGLRPGSTRDTKANVQAYGASTLRAKHAKVDENGRAHLDFIGKEGKHLRFHTSHPDIVSALQSRLQGKGPNDALFPNTSDSKMNNYLKNAVGPLDEEGNYPLVKDLRTYHANTTAADEVNKHKTAPKNKQEFLQRRKEVATKVSQRLGNTPIMALNSYINPSVFDPWLTDPSWAEAKKKARFAMDHHDDDHEQEVEEMISGMKPEVEKALMAQWLESILFTHNDGSMDVDDPEGDEDSK